MPTVMAKPCHGILKQGFLEHDFSELHKVLVAWDKQGKFDWSLLRYDGALYDLTIYEALEREQDVIEGVIREEVGVLYPLYNSHIKGVKHGVMLQKKIKNWYDSQFKKNYLLNRDKQASKKDNVAELVDYLAKFKFVNLYREPELEVEINDGYFDEEEDKGGHPYKHVETKQDQRTMDDIHLDKAQHGVKVESVGTDISAKVKYFGGEEPFSSQDQNDNLLDEAL